MQNLTVKKHIILPTFGHHNQYYYSHLEKGWFEDKFLEEHPFWVGGFLVWFKPDVHPFLWNIHFAKSPFFYSSCSYNHPGAKSVLRHGIDWIPSPKQQRRPLPSVWFFFYATNPRNADSSFWPSTDWRIQPLLWRHQQAAVTHLLQYNCNSCHSQQLSRPGRDLIKNLMWPLLYWKYYTVHIKVLHM